MLLQAPVISIVDDDESVREATKGLVRSLGYTAVTFGSAEEFLSSERMPETSCIIADVQMPGVSGVEMQDRLIAEGHRLPVIFITAFPEDRVRERALEAGAIGYLSKPFNEEHLIGCLDKALGNRAPGRPS
ncbi:response regulator [Nordella sp. HKS 07]|nr:response regulator [Nordella sp. HKS 07]